MSLVGFYFGIADFTANTESYFNILYDITQVAVLNLDFRGIGLPKLSYLNFINLISIAS